MDFSPILMRELAVAAKRRSTSRVRWWAALIAIIMSAGFLIASSVMGGNSGIGETCFRIQTFYLFGLAMLSGVFLTADCLSEERREETLGFLLLADVSEFDIVMGKFAVTSLTAFYGLLALLPISALPMLLGGVTGVEFWRLSLVELNAMFVSLAIGMLVSAGSTDAQQAIFRTLIFVLVLFVGVPLILSLLSRTIVAAQLIGWLSPGYLLTVARVSPSSGSDNFSSALIVSHLCGWAFLVLATFRLKRSWRNKDRNNNDKSSGGKAMRADSTKRRELRAKMLEANPALWLISSLGARNWYAWGVVGLWACVTLALAFSSDISISVGVGRLVKPFAFILKALFAFEACRFFIENRRAGALELLLCTPLTQQDILRGQSRAFRERVQWPCFYLILSLILPFTLLGYSGISAPLGNVFVSVMIAIEGVRLIADVAAILWVGMRLSLYMKKPQYAPAMTILIVLIAPSMLCWLDLVVDLVLIAWAKSGLSRDWRELLVTGAVSKPHPIAPPVIQPPQPPYVQ